MEAIDVVGLGWSAALHRPRRFSDRLIGMARPLGAGMLFRASSVHGFGMRRPLTVVAVDPVGRVIAVSTLRPWTLRWHPRARWIIELEAWVTPPRIGQVLVFYARSHAGTTRCVLDADREPR